MSSLASTNPAGHAAAPRQARHQPETGYLEHHGFWSPGIRLFGSLQFKSKALIVSAAFLVPIILLAITLWKSTQDVVDFATKERAGVAALRLMVPVYENVLEVRNATRAKLSGFDSAVDYNKAREKTEKSLATFKASVSAGEDPLGLAPSVAKLEAAWQATAPSNSGADSNGRTVFGPVTAALTDLLVKVGDDSNLVLDPDVDSFYLVNAMVLMLPLAAEEVGQVWGWGRGTYGLTRGGLDEKNAKRFHAWSTNAQSKLAETRTYFGRAVAFNPSLKATIDQASLDFANNFVKATVEALE